MHAITLATVDLGRAVEFLESKGIASVAEGEHHVWLDLDPAHGIRIGLTDAPVLRPG